MNPGEGYRAPHSKNKLLKVPSISFNYPYFSPIFNYSGEN